MIFCKANATFVRRVMEALVHFSGVTGLVANMEKSSIFMQGRFNNIGGLKRNLRESPNILFFFIIYTLI
ncbi:hypothetical protein MTR67_038433 [Solanum verrucosum]|uniref:Uncharacterized protein n=1 Tax=Solanum verrucosum TaxID=315347 RepID=A0AAF0ZPG6_SOLVR|nr:hypothetical protein MTR67_038433 [Solanum verrucosum]